MARNEQKRQKRLAKKKRNRKIKKTKLNFAASPLGQIEQASKMPVYECFVPEELEETGIGSVIFSRKMFNGEIAFCTILLDVFCLGVKNVSFSIFSISEYKYFLNDIKMNETIMPAEPACVRKLVEDCITFSRNIGFEPHKDYKFAKKIFGDVNSENCNETFTFGKNGKPFYISGPFDTKQKIDKIHETLIKNCGEGNFDFLVVVPEGEFDLIFDD